ncbi:MAG TPA: YtxH domain-containing protein [Vicinamibacterales bacterium]
MRNSSGGHRFVVGLLCGAAVGAAAGLLFAPKRGAALRKDLAKSANDVTRRAMKLYDGAADVVSDLADHATDTMDLSGNTAEKVRARSKSEHHRNDHA